MSYGRNQRRREREEAYVASQEAEAAVRRLRIDQCWQVPDGLQEAFIELEDALGADKAEAVWKFIQAVKEAGH